MVCLVVCASLVVRHVDDDNRHRVVDDHQALVNVVQRRLVLGAIGGPDEDGGLSVARVFVG